MNKKFLTVFVFIFLFIGISTVFAEKVSPDNTLLITKIKSKFGLKDKEGKIIVKPVYDKMQRTSYDLIVAVKNNKLGLIDKNGKILFQPKYRVDFLEYHFNFSDGLAAVIKKTRRGINCVYIDKDGNEVLDPMKHGFSTAMDESYGSCSAFSEGLAGAVVVNDVDYSGYINKKGEMVIKLKDVDTCGDTMCLGEFKDGKAKVVIKGVEKYIDKNGNFLGGNFLGGNLPSKDNTGKN